MNVFWKPGYGDAVIVLKLESSAVTGNHNLPVFLSAGAYVIICIVNIAAGKFNGEIKFLVGIACIAVNLFADGQAADCIFLIVHYRERLTGIFSGYRSDRFALESLSRSRYKPCRLRDTPKEPLFPLSSKQVHHLHMLPVLESE